ncbi:hypothetical protein [Kaistella carnis]|uniref:hypothetical protein n=1 Tax=Kaistella carnis TaxID=1241979 RepID=UPI00289F8DFE|nr:hypothetical protein [Kaistella carnis]
MNGRILELAKNPELFQINDLEIINTEIKKNPYMQSLRALHLLGTHRLMPENYTNELSVTAAYTTDKKILYQLINSPSKKEVETPIKESEKETPAESVPEKVVETPETKFVKVKSDPVEAPKPVYVNGELNRILFEGEEDFLERETEIIDLESTIESGQIVTQKPAEEIQSVAHVEEIQNLSNDSEAHSSLKEEIVKENPGVEDQTIAERATEINLPEESDEADSPISDREDDKFSETPNAENFSGKEIIEVNRIEDEKEIAEKPTDVSFQEVEEFLPEIKVEAESENPDHVSKFAESPDAENFRKEKIIKEEALSDDQEVIENSAELSFHATADFLPEVKITPVKQKPELQQPPKQSFNKHEEEMNRLIAEVEAKMKASKKTAVKEEDESLKSAEVNFSETQNFDLSESEEKPAEKVEAETVTEEELPKKTVEESVEKPIEKEAEKTHIEERKAEQHKTDWKPMSFSANIPDALISKKTEEIPAENKDVEKVNIPADDKKEEEVPTERPAFNVSFFTQNVSPLTKEKKEEKSTDKTDQNIVEEADESNVPTFINTWQNWLKIDRSKETENNKSEISITEIKNKVIENFIEKEPRISKLKEESDFVIRERNDDISHLMTETLANLYIEQKLYAKAIKAFGLLSEKHPSKEKYFKDKIKEIKELRQNK